MKVICFPGVLGLGGTEKAACRWARGLRERGHEVFVLSPQDGPRRAELERQKIPVQIVAASPETVATAIRFFSPDAIHAHAPGFPSINDVLGDALKLLARRIPVVQTNVFGKLENPREDEWTDFRLFISWTSCIQAARRSFRDLDENFFRRQSVAVYPLDPVEPISAADVAVFRKQLGVAGDEILFGRLSRPEPNKWTPLALDAFRRASHRNSKIKLLLREPPPAVAGELHRSPDAGQFIILAATADAEELRRTLSALDVILHTSSIGESFGYGIAEPMNLGKPVVTHSTPWADQAQIELVRHGECGFVASTPAAMADAMLRLADDAALRGRMGRLAQQHIRGLASPEISLDRLENFIRAAIEKRDNPSAAEDLQRARETAAYLDAQQFGHSFGEQISLRQFYYRVRLHQWRKNRGV